MLYCIYALIDPTTQHVVYVGKTTDQLQRRLSNHMYKAASKRSTSPVSVWINKLHSVPIIPPLEERNDTDWQLAECSWISHLRSQGIKLLNVTAGGNGAHERIELASDTIKLLGVISDARIAEKLGCSRELISWHHRKLGIAASHDRSRVKPNYAGRSTIAIDQAIIDRLGTVPDCVLADEAGVSEQTIQKRRRDRGIESNATRLGTYLLPPKHVGETHPMAKLSASDVKRIRKLRKNGFRVAKIAEMFHVTVHTIYDIINGVVWRSV